jgi:CPA1 family monovalent cation:H+ antiporter
LGLIIGALPGHPSVALTPNLVMLVFLPALLFAGAWTYPVQQLRRNWLPIGLLSTAGVLITIATCWAVLVYGAHMPSQTALIFGAIVSATDPVAVISVFRSLQTNEQLTAIVEGESLFCCSQSLPHTRRRRPLPSISSSCLAAARSLVFCLVRQRFLCCA